MSKTACFIASIYSNILPSVSRSGFVNANQHWKLGRANVSSKRFKNDIQPMNKASEALYSLKPISFRYKKEYDATQTLAIGLVAEDVAQVYPDFVVRDQEGQP